MAAALKDIYRAVDAAAGEAALDAFEEGPWGRKYPAIGQSWRRAWSEVIPFYAFPGDVRRIFYTTNAIEALNAKLRRAVRARGHFPTDEAAHEAALPGLEPGREGVEDAASRVGHGQGPVRRPLRRALHQGHGLIRFNRPAAHEIPDSLPRNGRFGLLAEQLPSMEVVAEDALISRHRGFRLGPLAVVGFPLPAQAALVGKD